MEFYEELKSWQSGIAAVVGFLALMSAALWNFHLNRRRDKEVLQAEAKSVLAALYGEIVELRKQAARVARVVARCELDGREFDRQFVEDYMLDDPVVFPALADRLGILDSDLVVRVSRFYSDYQEARRGLQLLPPREGFTYSPAVVLRAAIDAVHESAPLLRQAESELNLPACETPDIGLADGVLHEANAPR